MTPVEPVVVEGERLIVFAKDQPEYIPLPAAIDEDGSVTTEWEPTEAELDRLLCGGRIKLRLYRAVGVLTCSKCEAKVLRLLNPVSIEVIEPECGMRES